MSAPWQPENNRKKAYRFIDPHEKSSVFKKIVKNSKKSLVSDLQVGDQQMVRSLKKMMLYKNVSSFNALTLFWNAHH
jgi:Mg/Co/Ni transporter MgtE